MVPKLKRHHVRNVYSNSSENSEADLRGEGGGRGVRTPSLFIEEGGTPKGHKEGI